MDYAQLQPSSGDTLGTARKDTDNPNNITRMRKRRSTTDMDATSVATFSRDLISLLPASPTEQKQTTTSSALGYMRYSCSIHDSQFFVSDV